MGRLVSINSKRLRFRIEGLGLIVSCDYGVLRALKIATTRCHSSFSPSRLTGGAACMGEGVYELLGTFWGSVEFVVYKNNLGPRVRGKEPSYLPLQVPTMVT